MQLINELADQYALSHTSPLDIVLQQIYDDTIASHPEAHMISSPVQGKFLEFISTICNPIYILEIGTFTGFSAICLAKGLNAGGALHTIELRQEDANTAWKNISLAGMEHKIRLHVGDAKQIIEQLDFVWDLVFIDADKTGYIEYYEAVIPRLRKGGIIIADNVLFHGEVLNKPIKGKSAKAIDSFNQHILADERTEQIMITVRDGLMLIKKNN